MHAFSSGLLERGLLLAAGLAGCVTLGLARAGSSGGPSGPQQTAEDGWARTAAGVPYWDHRRRILEAPEHAQPTPPNPATPLLVAWFAPFDPADPVNGDLWLAAELAFAEANAEPDRPAVELRPCWAPNPWGTGVARLFHLVYSEPVVAILGSVDGPSTHLAEQVVAKAQLPLVSPISSDASVNFAGVPWMFSCLPADDCFAPVLADGIARERQARPGPLALVNATDHDARQTAQVLLRALQERGIVPGRRLEFTPGGDTFEVQLRALEELAPTTLIVLAGAEDSARFLLGLRRRNLRPVVFGGPAMGRRVFRERAGAAAEGVRFPALIATPENRRAEFRRFHVTFQARTGHSPDYAAIQTYDAARLLIAALRRAGPDRWAVRAALHDLSPWPGLAGEIRFDGLGRNLRSVSQLATIRGGVVTSLASARESAPQSRESREPSRAPAGVPSPATPPGGSGFPSPAAAR